MHDQCQERDRTGWASRAHFETASGRGSRDAFDEHHRKERQLTEIHRAAEACTRLYVNVVGSYTKNEFDTQRFFNIGTFSAVSTSRRELRGEPEGHVLDPREDNIFSQT